ncbi:hypothetical protein ABD05_04120 [Burkholderia pyrrocinia]|nr:hypothetical protein ABD05_04120 [Burkholderia pyrrocinia]
MSDIRRISLTISTRVMSRARVGPRAHAAMRARQPIVPAGRGGEGGAGSLLIEIKAIILNRFRSDWGRLYVGFMTAVKLF